MDLEPAVGMVIGAALDASRTGEHFQGACLQNHETRGS